MVKECPIHGTYEDLMAIDSRFLTWIEKNFPGRDIPAHNDEGLHKHGSSTVRYGRGSVLTVDLTNRCNMMCDPCFMDANQVGYVHELSWEEIQEVLDNAVKIKPRRQLSVQFSGGEPTMHPYFLDAIRYARKLGYNSVQAATNGIEFAKSKDFCKKAFEAGLRYAYLQFDGIGNDANSHRQVGNLFDVKLRAIENMHEAGIEIILVVTIVNNVNNDQVGSIVKFAMENPKKISFVAFQPVSFTGRDEDITPERRLRQRYTLSHLANDVSNAGRPSRADARLVPDFADQRLLRFRRSGARSGIAVGHGELRLPPELRRGHRADDQQGDQGVGAGAALPERAAAGGGRQEDHRRGARQDLLQLHDGPGAAQELPPLRSAAEPGVDGPVAEVRQVLGFDAQSREEIRQLRARTAPSKIPRSAAKRTRGISCSSPACGSRTCSTTTSAAPRCASSRTPRSRARFPSARTTPASAGGRSSRTCTRTRPSRSGTRPTASTRFTPRAAPWTCRTYEHSLMIDAEDAARVREREHDIPMTAAEEDKMRRRKALEEAAKVRAIYEEMVLKKPQPTVVQIGSVQQIKTATGPALTSIANAGATQAVNETEEVAAPAGD